MEGLTTSSNDAEKIGLSLESGLSIRVLGDFEVWRDGQPVELPPSRKTRALLAYLAVTGKVYQRERLCEIFWDIPDDPRGSLRWSLSKIRQVLGDDADSVDANRNTVSIDLGPAVDYARISRLPTGNLAVVSTEELDAAVRLVRGPFLADLSLDRCPDYEMWRRALTNELELTEVRLLRELAGRHRDDPERALEIAQRLQRALPEDPSIAKHIEALRKAARTAMAQEQTHAPQPTQATPHQTKGATVSPRDERQRQVRYCKGKDGVRIAWTSSGSGVPILRAAHWMSHLQYDWDSPIWRHWIAALSEKNTLVRYDERCNGMSDWEAEDVSFEAMVSDLEQVVEAAGLDRFTLLGISQGCPLSIAYAVRHPERISGMILYGGYVKGWRARGNASETATREALATLMREGWGKKNALFRQLFSSLFIRGGGPEHLASLDELQQRTLSPENAWRLQNTFADIDVEALLPLVRVPTLVLHAREDAVAPLRSGQIMAAEISGARFIELESMNHIMLEGEPAFDAFLQHVTAFVAETNQGA